MRDDYDDYRPTAAQRKRRREKRKMRRKILFTQWVFVALFAAMGTFICFYSLRYKRELYENSFNGRESKRLAQITKGSILAADGSVLARTVENADGTETREYPYGNVFAHVVGYADNGASGLEYDYSVETSTSSLSLSEKAALDEKGEKYGGDSVVTTLDPVIQQAAYDAMGAYKGAIIVSDPKTGDILAMVSKPDFDPAKVAENWTTYVNEDPTVGTLLNRVTQGAYPPGSTFKIVDTIEYLKEHPDDWQNYSFDCTGDYIVDNYKIHCFHYEVHGEENLLQSFANSCNCSFGNIGLSLDKDEWNSTMSGLLFNRDLPYDYTYNQSSVHLTDDTDTQETVQVAIGQGETSMSPLHMNLITNAVANGGVLMNPRLVSAIDTAAGTTVKTYNTKEYGQLFDSWIADELCTMMRAVVTDGTATKLADAAYEAAGKTGSAEYDASDETKSHAWFTGFAPVDDPQVSVTVIMEGGGSGGEVAVPAAKAVLDAYFAKHPEAASSAAAQGDE